jgi:hypothetical protein
MVLYSHDYNLNTYYEQTIEILDISKIINKYG